MENETAQKLGMTQTHYVNPNGLPADGQITSARDLAILARSIIKNLPEYEYFVHIPSIRYGKRITQNFNRLIGRYPGADGFKTGFICASGYNLVASATRDGRRLIAVVLGASSGTMRAVRAAQLLDRGFANNGLAWLRPSLGTVDQLAPIDASPPDLHDEVCGGKHHKPSDDDDALTASAAGSASASGDGSNATFLASNLQAPMPRPSEWLAAPPAPSEPIVVYTGPTRTGAALVAAVAADADSQAAAVGKRGKRHAAKKPSATAEAKPADASAAKPAAKHAAAKPAAATDPAAPPAKPAKPKANAKPKSGPTNGQKTSGETKPAGD
jgi:D-alanyl-D-alanine carboxypeptidase